MDDLVSGLCTVAQVRRFSMTDRNRRILLGFVLMFGLQFIVAWIARTWFGIVGNANNIVGFLLIFTVAIYFGGGMIMGLLSEKMIWAEVLATASVAVILNSLLYLIGAAPDLTFISVAFSSKSPILFMFINFASMILSAVLGDYIGVRVKNKPSELEEVSISPERRSKAVKAVKAVTAR
jgi:hypothetical protein